MSDLSITALPPLGAVPADDDVLALVDVSDPLQSPQGSTEKNSRGELLGGVLPLRVPVKNANLVGSIPKGTLLMATGALGDRILVAPAVTDGSVAPIQIVGITPDLLGPGGDGYAESYAYLEGFNTLAYPVGTILWNDPSTPGALTTAQPSAPNLKIPVAIVVRQDAVNGVLFVRETPFPRLRELSDVQAPTPANRQRITWSQAGLRWQPAEFGSVRQVVYQFSHGFSAGAAVSKPGASYALALADIPANSLVVGVVESVTANTFVLVRQGLIGGLAGLVPGSVYYLSGTVPGQLSTSSASGGSTVVKPVLLATSATAGVVINSLQHQGTGLTGAAGGDLSGSYPSPTVVQLQGRPLSAAAPAPNDFLTWTGSQWEPA